MQQLQEGRFNHDVVHATIASASASAAAAVTCCEALAHHVHLKEMQQMQKGQFNHDIVHATIASAAAAVTCFKALAHQVHLKGHRLQFAGTMRSHVLVQPCLCQNICTCNTCNSGGSISSGNLGGQQMAGSSSNDASVTSYRSSSTLLKPVHLMSNTREGSRSQTQCTAMSTVHATNRATAAAAAALCVEALAHHLNLQEGQPIAECKQFSIEVEASWQQCGCPARVADTAAAGAVLIIVTPTCCSAASSSWKAQHKSTAFTRRRCCCCWTSKTDQKEKRG
jgi:hypothetical protein